MMKQDRTPDESSPFTSLLEGEGHYNWDSTRKTGKRQAEDIMDEQHYCMPCMDWANIKCYIEEDRGKK